MLRRAGYEFDFFVARNVIQTDVDSQVLSDFEKKKQANFCFKPNTTKA